MELEINYRELARTLAKKIWISVVAAVVLAALAVMYTLYCVTPMYASTARLYVRNRQSVGFSSSEITAYSDLTKDYMQFVYSDTVLNGVIEEVGLDTTASSLKHRISVSNPAETRVLVLQVSDSDPIRAKQTVDALCQHFRSFITELMREDQVTVYDEGTLPTRPSSPSVKRNMTLAAMLGFLVPMAVVGLLYMTRNTIVDAETVERNLGLKVIGKVPYSAALAGVRSAGKKHSDRQEHEKMSHQEKKK